MKSVWFCSLRFCCLEAEKKVLSPPAVSCWSCSRRIKVQDKTGMFVSIVFPL